MQLAGGDVAHVREHRGVGHRRGVQRELHAQAVHHAREAPRGSCRVGCAESADPYAFANDLLQHAGPRSVELLGDGPEAFVAQCVAPRVDPEHPALVALGRGQVLLEDTIEPLDWIAFAGH